jgi:hypothetical protein
MIGQEEKGYRPLQEGREGVVRSAFRFSHRRYGTIGTMK